MEPLLERFRLDVVAEKKWDKDDREFIGSGGFAEVYREVSREDDDVQQSRAVKVINKKKMEKFKVDYMREVLALATFSERLHDQHGVFVTFLGWFENSSELSLSMEYFEFGTLDDYITQPIPENEVKVITRDILGALSIMHKEDFTHRDLKPSNIFVFQKPPEATQWWVKLGDFGISKRAVAMTTRIGTYEYTAPEVHGFVKADDKNAPYDKFVDMWSLGCVIYEIATSARLFPSLGDVSRFCDGKSKFPEEALLAKLSKNGVDFVKGLVVSNPQKRLALGSALETSWLSGDVGRVLKNRWYGIMAYYQFDPHKHDAKRRVLDPSMGDYRVEAMSWFTQQKPDFGDTKQVVTVLPFTWTRDVSDGPPKMIQLTIYASESPTPPVHPDSNVFKYTTLQGDLSHIPTEQLQQEPAAGNRFYYRIDFDVELKMHSKSVTFNLVLKGNYEHRSVEFAY
ncbi:kinase-like domain-containing protein [Halenospora varia]|nr:kinase-like domain-containing protein [Halenospora varia]